MCPNKADRLLGLILETIPDLVWLKDNEGVYLSCNPSFARFFGVTEAEIIGKTDYDFVDAEIADSFREHDRNAAAAGAPTVNEEWITYASDGRRALVETVKTPAFDEAGNPIGILGIAREVTELREAQNTIGEREGYLRALVDNFPFLVWLKDTESRFLTVNSAFAQASVGGTPADVEGRTDLDVWPRDLADAYRADDKTVLESRQSKNVEEEISEGGERRWFETFKAPVIDGSGQLLGTVGFARDISKRKQAEEALRSRDALLSGLARVTDCMLSEKELTGANIADALCELGQATGVDRVYIFENIPGEPGTRGLLSQRYEWSVDDVDAQIDNPDLQDIPWDDVAPRWYDTFVAGGYIAGNVVDFPQDERDALEPQDIVSLLALPIEANGKIWGFIGFDVCKGERAWTETEASLLKATAKSFAVTVERMRADVALRESEENFSAFFEAIDDMVSVATVDGRIIRSNSALRERLGYDESDLDGMHILDLHPAEAREDAEAVFDAILRGDRDSCTLPLITKDGEIVPVQTRIWFGKWNGVECVFGVSAEEDVY
ncbi:MAG: PAS domain S-box protein [Coriobacteriia bacterium]|nr:PAS domain S-box protein [Coriobacteriia bacterium]